jgi:hypothetical protein
MYVVRRLVEGYEFTTSSPAVSRTHNPFTLGASPDVSSVNLGTENEQRFGDSGGSRRHGYDIEGGEKGKKVPTGNEWERIVGGRGEAWWKARVPERRTDLRRTRRCVSLTASPSRTLTCDC